VHRLYHRNDPIITASPEYRPTARAEQCFELLRAAYIRDQVEKAGVPDVKAVASYFRRFLTVIAIRQAAQNLGSVHRIGAAAHGPQHIVDIVGIDIVVGRPLHIAPNRLRLDIGLLLNLLVVHGPGSVAGAVLWTRSFRVSAKALAHA
jgi:hypothetical protein